MLDNISYPQMLSEMESLDHNGKPKPFSVIFVSADLKRNIGGDIYAFGKKNAFMSGYLREFKDTIFTESLAIKVVGTHKGKPKFAHRTSAPTVPRNPHHDEHDTINILIEVSNRTRTIHPRLILYFNDKLVVS